MIFINKVIQILKVLYPNRIEPEDFFEVYENVIPQIQKLIDGVALGYHSEKLIELKDVEAVADTSWMHDEPAHNTVPEKQAIQPFEEELKHNVDDSWELIGYNDSEHLKNGDDIRIKGNGCIIDTTWEYLSSYFNLLPDVIKIIDITGLNKKKQVTLAKFYQDHPNFHCHINKVDGVNSIVKDEVRLNTNTNGNGECGTMNVDDFNGVSEE